MRILLALVRLVAGEIILKPGGPYNTTGVPIEDAVNVHLVCHSHDDVGWLKTGDQYFAGLANNIVSVKVAEIYDSVFTELQKDKSRKFVVVEIYFFSRWWRRLRDGDREIFKNFVKSGQITFLNGGWVMNDEASPLFSDMIDQMTLGADIISSIFGESALPKTGWQIDPFGHSRFQADLFRLSGYDGYFLGRIDFQDLAVRTRYMEMEAKYRGIFVGYLDGSYVAPRGFKWSRFGDDPIQDDPLIDGVNVQERLQEFGEVAMKRFALDNAGNSGDVILTMGDDFEYQEASSWFGNIDKLIHYSKQFKFPGDRKLNIFYSTPEVYMQERMKKVQFSVKSDETDFFPYCDGFANATDRSEVLVSQHEGGHAYWSGYYASRVNLKRQIRRASEALRTGELLLFIIKSPSYLIPEVQALREMVATMQHHDNISGTQKKAVADLDSLKMAKSVDKFKRAIEKELAKQLHKESVSWSDGDGSVTFNPSSSLVNGIGPLCIQPSLHRNASVSDDFPGVATVGYYRSSTGLNMTERPGQADGAYIFRPDCPEGDVAPCVPEHASFGSIQFKRRTDLERDGAKVFELEYYIDPIPITDGLGKDVVVVLAFSEIQNLHNGSPVIFTDSNGRGLIKRVFNHRDEFKLNVTDPVAGNFYPFTTHLVMNDSTTSISVFTDRSLGAGVLRQGQVEVMVHRRTLFDDWRGVGEPLNQTDAVTGSLLVVVQPVSDSNRAIDDDIVDKWIMFPMQTFQTSSPVESFRRCLPQAIPESVALLTARYTSEYKVLLRFYHKGIETGSPALVDLHYLLEDSNAQCEERRVTGQVTQATITDSLVIQPGEIRTVVCTLSAQAVHAEIL